MPDVRHTVLIGAWAFACALGLACGRAPAERETPATIPAPVPDPALPPAEASAPAALNASPRHGEWVDVALPGSQAPISTWVVYPERPDPAPVVLVVHDIDGLTDWIRGVADRFAADGFMAVAPDLLPGVGSESGGPASPGARDHVEGPPRTLGPDERTRRLNAVRTYALSIPSSTGRLGAVGFGWGGGASFAFAIDQPDLDAAVVYDATAPAGVSNDARIAAPVLGLYGGDERVQATLPRTEAAMARAGTVFEPVIFEEAGRGFLRDQHGQTGANLRATQRAWPLTIAFLREHLGT